VYLVTTTWRDVLDAAATVGRDPIPWFAEMPELAWSECVARWSPLQAYLRRQRSAHGHEAFSGFLLEPNAVYSHGTERTAKAAFGYRIGMTMAEWMCRGQMGLGPTVHAEASIPEGAGPAWLSTTGLPDLVGDHWHSPITWLVEAKGARRTGLTALAKGALQLTHPGLMSGPHARVLCGTSLEPRLFVTVDVDVSAESVPHTAEPEIPDPDTDDGALVSLARSRMLTYYSLRALPASARSVRPIGPAVTDRASWRRRTGLVYPLENDPTTRAERLLARDASTYASQRPPSQRLDMLTGRIPGTDVLIGISRRLFEACRNLATEEQHIADETLADFPHPVTPEADTADMADEEIEEFAHERRAAFAEREAAARPRLRATVREGFDRGKFSSWQQLLNNQPGINLDQPDLLESATEDTYLAIGMSTAFI
jgi:hypothetical protein